jgi:hypothetical protein
MRYRFCVAATDKALRKMRQNPATWRIEDLLSVAEENDLEWR